MAILVRGPHLRGGEHALVAAEEIGCLADDGEHPGAGARLPEAATRRGGDRWRRRPWSGRSSHRARTATLGTATTSDFRCALARAPYARGAPPVSKGRPLACPSPSSPSSPGRPRSRCAASASRRLSPRSSRFGAGPLAAPDRSRVPRGPGRHLPGRGGADGPSSPTRRWPGVCHYVEQVQAEQEFIAELRLASPTRCARGRTRSATTTFAARRIRSPARPTRWPGWRPGTSSTTTGPAASASKAPTALIPHDGRFGQRRVQRALAGERAGRPGGAACGQDGAQQVHRERLSDGEDRGLGAGRC